MLSMCSLFFSFLLTTGHKGDAAHTKRVSTSGFLFPPQERNRPALVQKPAFFLLAKTLLAAHVSCSWLPEMQLASAAKHIAIS